MEDVLDVYERPYDQRFPQVCMDETSKQLVGKNLALVVDGKVHGAPRIVGALNGGYRIGGLNRADAERMATAISNGCRR